MLFYAVLIFVVVMGSVFAFALVTNWLVGASGTWKTLAERYPGQASAEIAEKRIARILLSATDDPKGVFQQRGCLSVGFLWFTGNRNAQNVRAVIDDYFLHLDLDSGAGGPKAPLSIPWGAVQIGDVFETHFGAHAVLTIDEFTMLVPTASIERELLMRQSLQETAAENPFADEPGEGAY